LVRNNHESGMSVPAQTSPSLKNWILLITIGLIWGTSFMMMSVALRGFGPVSIAASRVTLAAILLVSFALLSGKGLPPLRGPKAGWVWAAALCMGFFSNAFPFFLLSWGQQYVASGFAGVTMAAVPLLILPLAHFLVPGERLSWLKGVGFTLGFIGVLMLIGLNAFKSLGVDNEATARLACFGAAGCYAIGSIITRLCPPVSKIALAAATMLMASLISLPMALWLEGVPEAMPLVPTLSILVLGVFPTAVAQLILVVIVRESGPSFMSLVNYQVPIWSLIFGALILGEHLPTQFFAALALILFGMALSQWKVLWGLFRPAA